MVIRKIKNKLNELDEKIKRIMKIGIRFSFMLCILAVLSLFTYEVFYSLPSLFYVGISLLQSGLMFLCAFFICGVGFDTIKKQMV